MDTLYDKACKVLALQNEIQHHRKKIKSLQKEQQQAKTQIAELLRHRGEKSVKVGDIVFTLESREQYKRVHKKVLEQKLIDYGLPPHTIQTLLYDAAKNVEQLELRR